MGFFMTQTWTEIVTELETAKTAILTGAQSYSGTGGRSATNADLKAVMEELRKAKLMAAREANGGILIKGATPVD